MSSLSLDSDPFRHGFGITYGLAYIKKKRPKANSKRIIGTDEGSQGTEKPMMEQATKKD